MTWDDELESIAATFAAKCIVAHNPDRHKQARHYDWVGENIAWGTGLCGDKECGDIYEGEFAMYLSINAIPLGFLDGFEAVHEGLDLKLGFAFLLTGEIALDFF